MQKVPTLWCSPRAVEEGSTLGCGAERPTAVPTQPTGSCCPPSAHHQHHLVLLWRPLRCCCSWNSHRHSQRCGVERNTTVALFVKEQYYDRDDDGDRHRPRIEWVEHRLQDEPRPHPPSAVVVAVAVSAPRQRADRRHAELRRPVALRAATPTRSALAAVWSAALDFEFRGLIYHPAREVDTRFVPHPPRCGFSFLRRGSSRGPAGSGPPNDATRIRSSSRTLTQRGAWQDDGAQNGLGSDSPVSGLPDDGRKLM